MATAVATVKTAPFKAANPRLVTRVTYGSMLEPDVTATGPHAIYRDTHTRPISLADHCQAKPTVQHVIRRIELSGRIRIAPGEEVHQPVSHINDGFLCTRAVHRQHLVV